MKLAQNRLFWIFLCRKKLFLHAKIIKNQNKLVYEQFSGCSNLGRIVQVRYFYGKSLILAIFLWIFKILFFTVFYCFYKNGWLNLLLIWKKPYKMNYLGTFYSLLNSFVHKLEYYDDLKHFLISIVWVLNILNFCFLERFLLCLI